MQRIRRLGRSGPRTLDSGTRGLRVVLLRVDGTLGQRDLPVERDEARPGTRQCVLIGTRVDLEQQIALLDRLVVADCQFSDAPVDFRHDVDCVRIDVRIVGARLAIDEVDHEEKHQ